MQLCSGVQFLNRGPGDQQTSIKMKSVLLMMVVVMMTLLIISRFLFRNADVLFCYCLGTLVLAGCNHHFQLIIHGACIHCRQFCGYSLPG